MTDWEPGSEAEAAMRDALRTGNQELYFRILSHINLLLPVSPEAAAGRAPMGWGTWTTGGRTHVLAFTTAEAMRSCLAEHVGSARKISYQDLAEAWPNDEWWLAINPGLPIEGYLPAWFVSQLARGDVRLPGRTIGARARVEAATRSRGPVPVTTDMPRRSVNPPPPADSRSPSPVPSGHADRGAETGTQPADRPATIRAYAAPVPPPVVPAPLAPPPVPPVVPAPLAPPPVVPLPLAPPPPVPTSSTPLPRRVPGQGAPPPVQPSPASPAQPVPMQPSPAPPAPAQRPPFPPAPREPAAEPERPAAVQPGPAPEPAPPPADEQPFEPANGVEADLLAAASDGHTDSFLSTLLLAKVLLPLAPGASSSAHPGDAGFEWRREDVDGQPYVVVFTSPERMREHLPADTAALTTKFVQLIRAWPDESWSFAVNPGSPVGATLPGGQIKALAAWAAEVGLSDEPSVEFESAQAGSKPAPSGSVAERPVIMQKPVAPTQVAYFLERGYDRVSGFVHRASEVAHLTTPEQLYGALGLGYAGSPFKPSDDEVYVLRWTAYRPNLYRIPYGGRDEAGMRAMQGWVIERAPFRGNGFAPGESDDVIAEFKVDSCRLPHNAQMWRLTREGRETLVAVLDADGPRWVQMATGRG